MNDELKKCPLCSGECILPDWEDGIIVCESCNYYLEARTSREVTRIHNSIPRWKPASEPPSNRRVVTVRLSGQVATSVAKYVKDDWEGVSGGWQSGVLEWCELPE